MFKNLSAICATTVFVGVLLFGREVASYLTVYTARLSETARKHVPVEFELQRAERMISDLTPQIHRSMHAIAREEVELERLAEKIAALEDRQSNGKVALRRLQQELDSDRQAIYIGGTRFTSVEAERLAETRFERHKTDEVTLEILRRSCSARQKTLALSQKQLDKLLAAKQQLLAEVANLRARKMMNEVAQIAGKTRDHNHLARTRDLIKEIETRIEVDERITELEFELVEDLLQADVDESQDIARRISAYFGDELEVGNSEPATTTLAESLPKNGQN